MCTVTYIPTSEGYILSSNRDESPQRAYNPLVKEKIGNDVVMYPKDPKGGSWLFSSEKKETICVLNGAFVKHKHSPPYRESRGIIARQYFNYKGPVDYMKHIDLLGIEPFTMILANRENLFLFRWDGKVKYVETKDPSQSHIWSSSTLYSDEMKERRAQWFYKYQKDLPLLTLKEVRHIHRNGTVGDPTQDYIMNRNNIVRTVSISHVNVADHRIDFEFDNLIENTLLQEQFFFTAKSIDLSGKD